MLKIQVDLSVICGKLQIRASSSPTVMNSSFATYVQILDLFLFSVDGRHFLKTVLMLTFWRPTFTSYCDIGKDFNSTTKTKTTMVLRHRVVKLIPKYVILKCMYRQHKLELFSHHWLSFNYIVIYYQHNDAYELRQRP